MVVSKTEDGCPALIPDIALAKARTCVNVGLSSRAVKDKYVPDRTTQVLSMGTISQGNWAPFPGGVLCLAPPPTPEDLFEVVDADGSGAVSLVELESFLESSPLDSAQVAQLIAALPITQEQEATKEAWIAAWAAAPPKNELKEGLDGALGFDSRTVVGAIGVSGAAADEDEHCALAAAHAIGLATDPAKSLVGPTHQMDVH